MYVWWILNICIHLIWSRSWQRVTLTCTSWIIGEVRENYTNWICLTTLTDLKPTIPTITTSTDITDLITTITNKVCHGQPGHRWALFSSLILSVNQISIYGEFSADGGFLSGSFFQFPSTSLIAFLLWCFLQFSL